MCWSVCPKGFYANDIAGACQVCPIQLQCSTCVMVGLIVECKTCIYGTYFQTGTATCASTCNPY